MEADSLATTPPHLLTWNSVQLALNCENLVDVCLVSKCRLWLWTTALEQ